MESLVLRLYKSIGLRTTDYNPVHTKGLSNEFYCYANFDNLAWKWRPAIEER
jgi:EEF1A lysine methyltransferase 1